jgi:hypothetical protein
MSLTILAAVTAINDMTMLTAALTPLVQQAMASGATEISDADVAAARARLSGNIDALDALIAKSRADGEDAVA